MARGIVKGGNNDGGKPGLVGGYKLQPKYNGVFTDTDGVYHPGLNISGVGIVHAISAMNVMMEIFIDDIRYPVSATTTTNGYTVPSSSLSPNTQGSANGNGSEFGLFFNKNFKINAYRYNTTKPAQVLVSYSLKERGATYQSQILDINSVSNGLVLLDIKGKGFLNYIDTGGSNCDVIIDGLNIGTINSYGSGGVANLGSQIVNATGASTQQFSNSLVINGRSSNVTKAKIIYTLEV